MENGDYIQQQQEQQISGVQNQIEAVSESSKSEAEKKEGMDNVRKRLKQIEEEASKLRAQCEIGEGAQQEENEEMAAAAALAEKEEADSRSIYVGNVDYECTPEDVQHHFHNCGTVNRVTIMSDAFGQPKGYAYVEFAEAEAVQSALLLNETELHGRPLKVSPKRTNLPGMKQPRGRRFSRRPFMPGPPFFPSYGYGRVPRSRSFMRYSPY